MKRLLFVIIVCLTSVQLYSQHITEQESLDRALQYLDSNRILTTVRMSAQARDGHALKAAHIDADNVYAFNVDGGGFIIASGDERAFPVLGYSDNGTIEWESMPDNMRAWIMGYDEAIAAFGSRMDIGNAIKTASPEKTEIEPLVKTQWNQDGPYWDQIPLYDGADTKLTGLNCYTGCVATALAQIMKYYEWPKTPTTGIPSYTLSTSYLGDKKDWVIDSIPPVTFDWDNMLDQYDGVDSAVCENAVSTLMRYCAQAIDMDFSPNGSSASNAKTPFAVYSYFGYAPSAILVTRHNYDTDDWEDLMYNELAEGRPIPYSGFPSSGSGHAFICDGYDGVGFYHFNWGWGGSRDGYFSLSVINPTSRNIGYAMRQEAVIGIKPTDDSSHSLPQFSAFLNDEIEIHDSTTVYFYYTYSSFFYNDVIHDYAMGTVQPDGSLNPLFIGDPTDSIVYGNNWMVVELDTTLIKPGDSFVLYPMVRFRNIPGSDWQMLGHKRYCVNVGRSQEGEYYIYKDYPQLEVRGLAVTPDEGDSTHSSSVTVSVHNFSDYEHVGELYMRAIYHGDIKRDEMDDDTLYTISDYWSAAAYLRAGKNSDVIFVNIDLDCQGLVEFNFLSSDFSDIGTYVIDFNENSTTGVSVVIPDTSNDVYYDLMGRPLNGVHERKGIYIKGNRKIIIR